MPRRPSKPASSRNIATLCEHVLQDQLKRADEKRTILHVPQMRDHVMEHPGLHFHFNTDLIIGLKGSSRFEFIHEHFGVEAGAMAIIPGGIPHREVPLPGTDKTFENLVISVYNETVSIQLQVATADGKIHETITEYYDTTKYQQLAHYLDEIAELSHGNPPGHQLGIKGLLLVYFSTLEAVIHRARTSAPVEKLKISQTRRLIQDHLGDAHLSVVFLAHLLHCSSDYLSNLFHRETGQRLATYINVERIKAAMAMLRGTPLTIAEIAFAVGFESQGYFSRVFKQIALKTPLEYRRSIEHSVVQLEGRPRTIYAAPE